PLPDHHSREGQRTAGRRPPFRICVRLESGFWAGTHVGAGTAWKPESWTLNSTQRPITIATRGSALALAQANLVFDQCRAAFPKLKFEIKIIKTTGDKLQRVSLANPSESLPKGLFTRELEVALLKSRADLAVHSLKDLPTELPAGLKLGAVSKRVAVRDPLICRDAEYRGAEEAKTAVTRRMSRPSQRRGFKPKISLRDLPPGATIATSSTRRKAQLLANRPDLNVVEI